MSKIKKVVIWIRTLFAVVAEYNRRMEAADRKLNELSALIKDRTNIAVDMAFRGANHVIVVGRYRNADYIQTFELDVSSLGAVVDQLRERERYGNVRRVDGPPTFKAVFERELKLP